MNYWRYTFSIGFFLIGSSVTVIALLFGLGFLFAGATNVVIGIVITWSALLLVYLVVNYLNWKRYKNFNDEPYQ